VTDSLFKPIEPGPFQPVREGENKPRRYLCALTGFGNVDIGASATAVQWQRPLVEGSTAQGFTGPVTMPYAGQIVGISLSLSADRTAGTLFAEVYVNSTATGVKADINAIVVNHASGTSGQLAGFKAGDRIDVRGTTDASWTPVTADGEAVVFVVADIP